MASESKPALVAAVLANLAIAIMKFVAAAVTGSAAMGSEGIHSVVDTGDGLLLLVGMHLSRRPPDDLHPYGHAPELYFWSMVVAVIIFGVGGGISIYQGIHHLVTPRMPENLTWSYAVLGGAALFEGISFAVAIRQFGTARRGRGVWETVRRTKDPTLFTVVFEDAAALIGIGFALAGVTVAHLAGWPRADAAASIGIGLLLCAAASVLAYETRSLLIGERAERDVVADIVRIARAEPGVVSVARPLTMQLGPEEILVDLDLGIADDADAVAIGERVEARLRAVHPQITNVHVRFSRPARSRPRARHGPARPAGRPA